MSDRRGRFDSLFGGPRGTLSWREGLTDEEQSWLDDLLDHIEQWNGQMPSWRAAATDFADEFGEDRAPSESTLAKHVRKAWKDRTDDG